MSLFLLEPEWITGKTITFPPDQSRHLVTVLRKAAGDSLRCRDRQGNLILSEILSASPHETTALILAAEPLSEDIHPVTMIIPLLKAQRSELIVQKVTELGCDTIIPFFFERSVVRPNKDKHSLRLSRIAYESCKQCERSKPPVIHDEVTSFDALVRLLDESDPQLRLLPWEHAELSLRSALEPGTPAGDMRICLAVGPEGGIAPEEAARFSAAGFTLVSLGNNILRSETAAIAGLASLVYACRDRWHQRSSRNSSVHQP